MRVVIADCQSRVRFALRTLLKRQNGLEVVGEAATAEEVLEQVNCSQPDLVLLHWRLQETTPDLVRRLQGLRPGLRVIVLSARCETRSEALKAGAEAFIWKTEQPEKLLAAITAHGPVRDMQERASPDAVKARDGGRHQSHLRLATGGGLSLKDAQEEVHGSRRVAERPACLAPQRTDDAVEPSPGPCEGAVQRQVTGRIGSRSTLGDAL